jgi:tetratricopeptide (TPR) repeat protein
MNEQQLLSSLKSAGELLGSGNPVGALRLCEGVMAISPDHPIATTLAGFAHLELSDLVAAKRYLLRSLESSPKNMNARFGLAKVLEAERFFSEAASHYQQVCESQPEHHAAKVGYANCCVKLGQFAEALSLFDEVLHSTQDPNLHRNLAIAYLEQNELSRAEQHLMRLKAALPDDHDMQSQLATALLKQERFTEGWPFYEARLNNFFQNNERLLPDLPMWNGDGGEDLFIWSEEGAGDIAMFASVLPQVLQSSASVTLVVETRFHELFHRSFGSALTLISQADIARVTGQNRFSARASMATCMKYFRQTSADFICSGSGYLLPNKQRVARYRKTLLATSGNHPLVAISWRSFSGENGEVRSISLAQLLAALPLDRVRAVNLQYGRVDTELSDARAQGFEVLEVPELDTTRDIDGVVSAMSACDYAVSIDNTAAHLAGGLGMRQAVLLPFCSNWRWGHGRSSSLLYSQTTILQQAHFGDWRCPLSKLSGLIKV